MSFNASRSDRHRRLKLGLYALWLGLVIVLAWHHTHWRDEVRALSLALQGDSVIEMLKQLRGEGHPALWYLLLRAAHGVAESPKVLPVVSIGVASIAMLLLVLRSPFSWSMIALLLFGHWALFEYSVMARNYGISVLLLFLIAACYPRDRDRGVLLGVLLALLVNTNLHSVLLAGAVLLFWLIDILCEHGIRWTPAFRTFLLNAAVSAIGVAVCITTIYPTYNDAALLDGPERLSLTHLGQAVIVPAVPFSELVLRGPLASLGLGSSWSFPALDALEPLSSLIMFGSLLGLIGSPAAFIAGLAALMALSIFFVTVYEGSYRHEALWLVYLVSLYWMTRARSPRPERCLPPRLKSLVGPATTLGSALLVVLVSLQVPGGIQAIADVYLDRPPHSRSRDLGAFVSQRDDVKDAIIIADPEFLLESLPYYLRNRTYLMRERRFGNVVRFTKGARLSLSLDDVLATAGELRAQFGKPVMILLAHRLDPSHPAQAYKERYNWEFHTSPEQVSRFLASTRMLARFAPAKTDESFDVYVFDPS